MKQTLKKTAQYDPVVLEALTKEVGLTTKQAVHLIKRLELHEQNLYSEDEIELYEKHKVYIESLREDPRIKDVIISDVQYLQTEDGSIQCRRTNAEQSRSMLRFGNEVFGHHRLVEKTLTKGYQLYVSDSLDISFLDHLNNVHKSISYLRKHVPALNTKPYENECSFYEQHLSGKKEE